MKVKYWGVRGSIPAPASPAFLRSQTQAALEAFLRAGHSRLDQIEGFLDTLPAHSLGGYGGNTACIQIITDDQQNLIIDGGSGIRALGYELLKGPCGSGQGEVHLLFTHFHWDHLIGLPFFVPFFIPGNVIHVYAVQPELERTLKMIFQKPFFPVSYESLGSKIVFHSLAPREAFTLGETRITPYRLDHPDPCWGYRIEFQGKFYAHCVDTECVRVSREELGPDLPLYQGADLMTFDAQYTLMETIEKVNWGHAAAPIGLDLAMREGIRKVVFMHHDPAATEEKISAAENQVRQYETTQHNSARRQGNSVHTVDWLYAIEGMTVEV